MELALPYVFRLPILIDCLSYVYFLHLGLGFVQPLYPLDLHFALIFLYELVLDRVFLSLFKLPFDECLILDVPFDLFGSWLNLLRRFLFRLE